MVNPKLSIALRILFTSAIALSLDIPFYHHLAIFTVAFIVALYLYFNNINIKY